MVGRIGKPHGVRGEVAVDVRTDEPELRFTPGAVLRAEGSERRFTVVRARPHGRRLLVTFDEIGDRIGAEESRGTVLMASVDPAARPADPDEYYDWQLVGLVVHDTDGARVGDVTGVRHGAAQDLLVVRTPSGADALVPFVRALVPTVDLAHGVVVVADRPGLIDSATQDE